MQDREKLIEVLESLFVDYGAMAIFFTSGEAEVIADHLIANGVTVRERGRWHLEAHEEHSNYRWNVTAECPKCRSEKEEIYAAFFPGFPKSLAEEIVLENARTVKLSNFCPHCGADMRGEEDA